MGGKLNRSDWIGLIAIGISMIIFMAQVITAYISYETRQLTLNKKFTNDTAIALRSISARSLQMHNDIRNMERIQHDNPEYDQMKSRVSEYSLVQLIDLAKLDSSIKEKLCFLDDYKEVSHEGR